MTTVTDLTDISLPVLNLDDPPRPSVDEYRLAKLANEVALDIREISEVLTDYGISPAEYQALEKNARYRLLLEQYRIEWNSARSVHERLRLQAAVALEQSFPTLGARMQNASDPGAIETAKLMAKISGLDAPKQTTGGGQDRFSITINLGSDRSGPGEIKFDKVIQPLLIEAKDAV